MLLNCSNHPSSLWSEKQKSAATAKWGVIEDFPFPEVPSHADESTVTLMAEKTVEEIMKRCPTVVMCQGEFTLTYALISRLKEKGIPVVAACSERKTIEQQKEDGTTVKTACFEFTRFRRYD